MDHNDYYDMLDGASLTTFPELTTIAVGSPLDEIERLELVIKELRGQRDEALGALRQIARLAS